MFTKFFDAYMCHQVSPGLDDLLMIGVNDTLPPARH